MGEIKHPDKVKLMTGIIYSDEYFMEKSVNIFKNRYGEIDFESEKIRFSYTEYYNDEMGSVLHRKFISFENLIEPSELPSIKAFTNDIELKFSQPGCNGPKRRVNIDPGYLELSKLVLASTKNFAHRIYLDKGIFAETTLLYRNGKFDELEWTYPDYKSSFAKEFFTKVRAAYASQLKGNFG
jgi:hypothetical protein